MNRVVLPNRQIAKIMRRDAGLIDDCESIKKMLTLLSDNTVKIQMILRGVQGDIN